MNLLEKLEDHVKALNYFIDMKVSDRESGLFNLLHPHICSLKLIMKDFENIKNDIAEMKAQSEKTEDSLKDIGKGLIGIRSFCLLFDGHSQVTNSTDQDLNGIGELIKTQLDRIDVQMNNVFDYVQQSQEMFTKGKYNGVLFSKYEFE